MYESFFGLRQAPFSIAPDPRYLFMSERHREALAHLLYGLGGGGGFVLLTGEVGAGKTTVCRCFLEQVPASCRVAYIFNPRLSVLELLQSVCQEFGVALPGADGGNGPHPLSVKGHIDPLNAFLLQAHAEGRQCVLVIDEAQNLSADVLEQLRLLTNLETHERKLLQIVLIGQPELRDQLARPELEQLAQRVIARYHLGALSAAETAAYVAHRLAVAGHSGPLPFDRAALARIHTLTAGVPRRINLLCDRALLGAYAEGRAQAGVRVLDRAAAEVFDRRAVGGAPWPTPRLAWRWAAGGVVLGGALVALGGWLWRSPPPPVVARAAVGAAAAPAASLASASTATATSASASASALATVPGSAVALAVPAAAVVLAAPAATGMASAPGQPPLDRLPLFDPARDLATLPADEPLAWRTLAPAWGLAPAAQPPCAAAGAATANAAATATAATPAPTTASATAPWQCFRTTQASLALLRALNRPGLLPLQAAAGGGRPRYAQLVALDAQQLVLQHGTRRWRLPLEDLAALWHGDFITLWQPPPGYRTPLGRGASGPAVDALAADLAALRREPAPAEGQTLDGALATRLAGFQLAQGLRPDAVAGPTTFMQLSRLRGGHAPALPLPAAPPLLLER